ncbi:MAG: hypothetical protein WBC57_13315, partial [Candidatus Acidiferrales bacterium]
YLFLTAALSFKKGFSTRTLSEFGREPLLLLLKVQLKAGHPREVKRHFKWTVMRLIGTWPLGRALWIASKLF